MKAKKKVRFGGLREGAKFRYARKLYVKTDYDTATCISNNSGEEIDFDFVEPDGPNTLVIPVKVRITVI